MPLEENRDILSKDDISLIRRVLFSRSLRLLPLPQQVGIIEALTAVIVKFPNAIPLTDQHLLSCLSELLKLLSVADGDMTDVNLENHVVNKDGYVQILSGSGANNVDHPTHATSLFFRRDCVVGIKNFRVLLPGELPVGVQLRVSSIKLFGCVIKTHTDAFFNAEPATPIGENDDNYYAIYCPCAISH
jgi:transformation/transcription domain-associated protein